MPDVVWIVGSVTVAALIGVGGPWALSRWDRREMLREQDEADRRFAAALDIETRYRDTLTCVVVTVDRPGWGTIDYNGTPWFSWPIPVDALPGDRVPLHNPIVETDG